MNDVWSKEDFVKVFPAHLFPGHKDSEKYKHLKAGILDANNGCVWFPTVEYKKGENSATMPNSIRFEEVEIQEPRRKVAKLADEDVEPTASLNSSNVESGKVTPNPVEYERLMQILLQKIKDGKVFPMCRFKKCIRKTMIDSRRGSIESHVFSHTTHKPFSCPICGIETSAIRKHLHSAHKGMEPPKGKRFPVKDPAEVIQTVFSCFPEVRKFKSLNVSTEALNVSSVDCEAKKKDTADEKEEKAEKEKNPESSAEFDRLVKEWFERIRRKEIQNVSCRDCGKEFEISKKPNDRAFVILGHVLGHLGGNPFSCIECGVNFISIHSHYRNKHGSVARLKPESLRIRAIYADNAIQALKKLLDHSSAE